MRVLATALVFTLFPAASARAEGPSTRTICPGSATTPGLDMSDWQTFSNSDELARSGRRFAFIKAIEGNTPQAAFQSEWSTLGRTGLLRGAYAYFVAGDDPEQQAQNFIALLQSNGRGELPPMLDWESSGGVSAEQALSGARIWLNRVESWLREDQGVAWTPILYTFSGYWLSLNAPPDFARYPLFIAELGTNCPAVPAPWTSWTFWQRGNGSIPGFSDPVDDDEFNGSPDQLRAITDNPN